MSSTCASPVPAGDSTAEGIDAAVAERFAGLALGCVNREYPNQIKHVLQSDEDVRPPRELTPVFYGCFDWHSAVHGHWLLVRLCHEFPDEEFVAAGSAAVDSNITAEKVAVELEYLRGEGRATFERPYGLAWLLQLATELHRWDDPRARRWGEALAPLEAEAARRFKDWLPKLLYPIRTGEHSQTAFALGLVMDWAQTVGDDEMASLVRRKALEFHGDERDAPLAFEPSGQDFLSPVLGVSDLMRRVLQPDDFADWLSSYLPSIPVDGDGEWLEIALVSDRSDGKLAHLDGLNLSRAWMLEGTAGGLPEDDARRASLLSAARRHGDAGLKAVTGEHYEGGHWLGSFATYLATRAGSEAGGH